jgi:hypothetical protein
MADGASTPTVGTLIATVARAALASLVPLILKRLPLALGLSGSKHAIPSASLSSLSARGAGEYMERAARAIIPRLALVLTYHRHALGAEKYTINYTELSIITGQ